MGEAIPIPGSAEVLIAGTREWTDSLASTLRETHDVETSVVETTAAALDRVSERDVACVVAGYEIGGETAVDLLESIRADSATLPVVVCTDRGSEAIASAVVGAGATDYVALSGGTLEATAEVVERIGRAVRGARRTETQRDRARQFDAIFRDAQTATWVVDPAGRLQRANETARELDDGDIDAVIGEPVWTLSPWDADTETQSDVRGLIERVRTTDSTERIVTRPREGQTPVLELTLIPVHDPLGDLVAIVIRGADVSERVSLYRELRDSEELHRVTLSNMTDTVLMTDESGEFTYICPNVHFIFGYSVEEIREFGTIDRLLGADLFDRAELREEGVLTNIECRATDKAGEEHTLLVNVREVDIQDGDLLFSCRDVTKRKQREAALSTLQETTRRIQYAETKAEIAQRLVDDAADILDLPASQISLYRSEDNTLQPVAYTDEMESLHGPMAGQQVDEDTLAGYSFVNRYPRYYDDVRDADRFANEATDLRSAAFVPIGDHGLFVAGAPTTGAFDRVRRELTDLVGATAEAAFDRVARDSRLRSQDRQLQRRNEQLQRLDELNELIREIDRTLVRAETREDVDQTVCEALTDGTHFSFAWIGELDAAGERLEPTAWAGHDGGYLDAIDPTLGSPGGDPATRTAATREVTVVPNLADDVHRDDWQRQALRRGYQSAISVPLVYDDFVYGVLTVYAETPETFDDRTREVIAELGETVASAISALNRKNALLTSAGTRLEFETTDPEFTLTRLARDADCTLRFEGGVQRTDAGVGLFVRVTDGAVADLVDAAAEMITVASAQVLTSGESEGLVRLDLRGPFLATSLADHGAVLRRVVTDGETATLVVGVPTNNESQPVVQHVLASLAETELVAKHTDERTPTHELYGTFLDRVTERQLEVVQTAYYSGFFESPREHSGEEIAETLGISGPAFYSHTRTVQRKLFATLFDEIGVPAATDRS